MKRILIVCALFISLGSYAQSYNWGLGLRGGNPSGVSLKRYLSSTNALEFNLGRGYYWGRNWAYDYGWDVPPVVFQANYHFNKPIAVDAGEFIWYYGAGIQLRYSQYTYRYYTYTGNFWNSNRILVEETYSDLDLGPTGILGLEYTFADIPISIFADITLFMEIADDPIHFYGQGGAGARFNF